VWSVTTAKPGNGVENLRDGSTDTFWQCVAANAQCCTQAHCARVAPQRTAAQPLTPPRRRRSDGAQPHVVNIAFQRKVELLVRLTQNTERFVSSMLCVSDNKPNTQELSVYVDFKLDESYTPKTISVRAGNSIQDMKARSLMHSSIRALRSNALTHEAGGAHAGDGGARRVDPPVAGQAGGGGGRRCGRERAAERPSDRHPRLPRAAGGADQPPERARHARAPSAHLRPAEVRALACTLRCAEGCC
jgi:hypothetical protein